MTAVLPAHVQRVCSRCGAPVRVYIYASCPTHGRLHNLTRDVITRADWLLLQAAIARHPAGKGLR